MKCNHCGYDVPRGIDFCTNCGEPMPKIKEEAPQLRQEPKETADISKKEFISGYVPHSARLAVHTGAILSYLYSLLYLVIVAMSVTIDGITGRNMLFLAAILLLTLLTLGFHIKKSVLCAVVVTLTATLFTIYCIAVFHEVTVIWICAGGLATYGTAKISGLWNQYSRTKQLPKRID
ncbi:MAG: hypothetical protein ACOX8R_07455 [Bacillota bacterium]|jgi:hypothetical protein